MWPFFSHVDDREKKYHEWELPWPLVIFARGEGKTANRVWPFFSRVHDDTNNVRYWVDNVVYPRAPGYRPDVVLDLRRVN